MARREGLASGSLRYTPARRFSAALLGLSSHCIVACSLSLNAPRTTRCFGMMRAHGLHMSYLCQSQARSIARPDIFPPYRCHVHRTICHHARRPSTLLPKVTCYSVPRRGAKTKTTVKLKDLPQGALKLQPYQEVVDDAPKYPAVVQGHWNNMQKFKNCVILTRVGGFYEV